MKFNQGNASGLVGFFQELQRGAQERNQQRDQDLQRETEYRRDEREFNLRKKQTDQATTVFEQGVEDRELNKPVVTLNRTTALNAGNLAAAEAWNTASLKAGEFRTAAAAKRLEAATQRNPNLKQNILSIATNMETQAAQLLDGEKRRIGQMSGVTQNPWDTTIPNPQKLTAFDSITPSRYGFHTNSNTPNLELVTPSSAAPVTPSGAAPVKPSDAVTSNSNLFQGLISATQNNYLPLTTVEEDRLKKIATDFGLGSMLGVDYFQRPTLGYKPSQPNVKGSDQRLNYGSESYIKAPTSYDPDYGKFIGDKAQNIIEMLNEVGDAAETSYIPKEQAYKSILGTDKKLWPIEQNDKKEWVAKSGWWVGLNSNERSRFQAKITKFIAPSETLMSQVKDVRESESKSIESQILNERTKRDRKWTVLDNDVEAQLRKDLADIGASTRADPNFAMQVNALQTGYKFAYDLAKDNTNEFDKLASLGTEQKELAATLMGVESVSLEGVEMKDISALYRYASAQANLSFRTIGAVQNSDLFGKLTQQTNSYNNLSTYALRVAGAKLIKDVETRRTGSQAADKKKVDTINWIRATAGLPAPAVR